MIRGGQGTRMPRRWSGAPLAAVLSVLLAAGAADAQTITRGPYIQNPQALPTSATFVWWTNVAGDSQVEYGTTPALGSSMTVPQAGSCTVGSAGTCHTVTLTGLSTGTQYYYRLRTNGTIVQNTNSFITMQTPADPDITFAIIGDWGQGTSGESQIAARINAADPPMLLTVGDNAYPNGTQSDLDNNAMAYYQVPLQRMFYFPVLGNHDLNDVGGASGWANSAHIKTFVLPTNSPEAERYYYFEHGDALFIMLDSDGCCGSAQTTWMDNLLASTPRRWKFVFYHHTAYSCANGIASIGSDEGLRDTWGPIWEKHKVDVVFHGHDHIYERTKFMDEYLANGSPGSDGLGTTYIMSGGGGASLDQDAKINGSGEPYRQPFFFSPVEDCYWLDNDCPGGPNNYCSFDRYQYTMVSISGDTLTVQAIDNNGSVFDTFTLTKAIPTPTQTPTFTPVPGTATATYTLTPSVTATATATVTATDTVTLTPTPVASDTPTLTETPTVTLTPTLTRTPTRTGTPTSTNTPTMTHSRTVTPTRTVTGTATATDTVTPPPSATATATPVCNSGVLIDGARLDVKKNLNPAGDEKLKIKGSMVLSVAPPIDPIANGFTIVVTDPSNTVIFSRYVPPGLSPGGSAPGWKATSTTWQYKDTGAVAGGISKVQVKRSATVSGMLSVKVLAKAGAFQVPQSTQNVNLILIPGDLTTAANGQCATRLFNPVNGIAPRCEFKAVFDRLQCK